MFMTLPCIAEDVLYLDKKWDKDASKILYEYNLSELNLTPEKVYEAFGYKLSDVRAVFYDLNSDGVDEVIGYINSSYETCAAGAAITILKKEKGFFSTLAKFHFYPHSGVSIIDSKNDGYFDLKMYYTKIQLEEKPKLRIVKIYNTLGLVRYDKILKQYKSISE